MAIKDKPKILCASLLAAFGCLSAGANSPRYGVAIGKLSNESDSPLQAVYSYQAYPLGKFYYTIYEDQSKSKTVYRSSDYSFSILNVTNPWTLNTSIPLNYIKDRSFFLEAMFEVRENTWIASNYVTFRVNLRVDSPLEGQKTFKNPTPNTEYKIERTYASSANGYTSIRNDSYYVGEWKKDITNGLYHAINLPSCQIGYADALGSNIEMGGNAALYIYTDPMSWNIGTTTMINGQLVRTIPLQVNYIGQKTINGRVYRMHAPSLTRSYTVDRYNLKMYSSSYGRVGSNYFTSTDLFVPMRNKKESNTWRFGINWFGLSEFGDRFEMDFSLNLASNLFGNCDDALYCVGLGGF